MAPIYVLLSEPSASPQISDRGEVVDVDHGQLLLAPPSLASLSRVTGTAGSQLGQGGQGLVVRGAAGGKQKISARNSSCSSPQLGIEIMNVSPFLVSCEVLARRADLLLLPREMRGTHHLTVVHAVNGKQLVEQVGHLSG